MRPPKLSEAELESFLTKRHPMPPATTFSGLHGYITALAIGPKFVDPRYWVPFFVGNAAFESDADALSHKAMQTVLDESNSVTKTLIERPDEYEPRFKEIANGEFSHTDWIAGFSVATTLNSRAWLPIVGGRKTTLGLFLGDTALAADNTVTEREARQIATTVIAIRKRFLAARQANKI